jgi:hypothetical protein
VGADPLAVAAELHRRAVAKQNAGRPAAALALLHRALRLVDGAPQTRPVARLAAQLWISIAVNECDLHGLAAGRLALATSAGYAAQVADPAIDVLQHNQTGLIAMRTGELADALRSFDAAVALIEHAQPRDRFRIRLNRGALRLQAGELVGARSDLEAALAVARAAEFADGEFMAQHNLGYLEFLAGDLPRSIRSMDAAGSLQTDVSRGIWHLDRARVLLEAGLAREADESLADAAEVFRADRLAQDLGETELERARCALLRGDVAATRVLAARARDRFRRRGNDTWRRAAELVLLEGALAAGRPGRRVAESALRLHAELGSAGLPRAARTAGLVAAEALLAAGDPDGARQALAAAGTAGRADPISARLHERYVRARLAEAQHRAAEATTIARRGLSELARYQASFGSIDLSGAAAIHGRRLAGLDLRLALRSGRPDAVLAAAERTRAVTARLPAVRPPTDGTSAGLLAELRRTVESLRANEQDVALRRRRRELERAVAGRAWSRGGVEAPPPPAGPAAVRSAVANAGVTLLSFVQGTETLYCVHVSRSGARLLPLAPAAQVVELVRRARADLDVLAQPLLPDTMRRAVLASFRSTAERLDTSLLASAQLDSGPLVVVGTGVLGQLPWGLLPSLRGVPVVVAPSATAWLHASAARARPRRFAAATLSGPDLHRARDEAKQIADIWGAATPESSCATAMRAMADNTLVHVAAHGIHQSENPLFSSVRLSDGPLFAYELDRTARTPEHVVLSACELGLATVRPGDEALGLTSVLLRLGTRSVIAGVARVGDEAAERAMVDYHRRLAGGADSATALAGAIAAAPAPVPFVCFGSAWSAAGVGGARRRRVP